MEIELDNKLNLAIEKIYTTKNSFDIAFVFYTMFYNDYSCKSIKPMIWINKKDSTIPINVVEEKLKNDLTEKVKIELYNYNNKYKQTNKKEHKLMNKIIDKFDNPKYINNIIREACELFYNN